jgi:hypothetical protein
MGEIVGQNKKIKHAKPSETTEIYSVFDLATTTFNWKSH